MDRFDAMSLLISVVEGGSLSAASRKLGVPLPTVSRKISDLEAHLNTRLLTRSTRKLALTDSGAAYVTAARRILDEVSEADQNWHTIEWCAQELAELAAQVIQRATVPADCTPDR